MIRDQAEVMAQNHAAEIKVRAERWLGELLATMPKQHGARGVGKKVESHDVTSLSDIGIAKMDSSRWQGIASIPADDFEASKSAQRNHL